MRKRWQVVPLQWLFGTAALAAVGCAMTALYFGVTAATGGHGEGPPSDPKTIVREAAYVFPPALPGSFVQHTFIVRNDWGHRLKLSSLEPSCVCTKGYLTRTTVRPGGLTRLALVILLDQYSSGDKLGAILRGTVGRRPIRFVYIVRVRAAFPLAFANSTGVPYAGTAKDDGRRIRLVGRGSPNCFNFGRMRLGERARQLPAVLVRRSLLPLKWDRVTCSTDDPGMHATLTPAGRSRWDLHLTYKPDKFIGRVVSHVIFNFWENGELLKYRMYKAVQIAVRGPIYLSVPDILIGSVRRGKTVASKIAIFPENTSAKLPIRVLGVRYSNPMEFSATVGGTAENPVIRLVYTALKSFGEDTGHITISVQFSGRKYAFRVPYLSYVPGGRKQNGGK